MAIPLASFHYSALALDVALFLPVSYSKSVKAVSRNYTSLWHNNVSV